MTKLFQRAAQITRRAGRQFEDRLIGIIPDWALCEAGVKYKYGVWGTNNYLRFMQIVRNARIVSEVLCKTHHLSGHDAFLDNLRAAQRRLNLNMLSQRRVLRRIREMQKEWPAGLLSIELLSLGLVRDGLTNIPSFMLRKLGVTSDVMVSMKQMGEIASQQLSSLQQRLVDRGVSSDGIDYEWSSYHASVLDRFLEAPRDISAHLPRNPRPISHGLRS